jgi:hypothetical protein
MARVAAVREATSSSNLPKPQGSLLNTGPAERCPHALLLYAPPEVAEEEEEPSGLGLGSLVEQAKLQPLLEALHGPNSRWVVELALVDQTTSPADVLLKLLAVSLLHRLPRSYD